MPADFTPLSTPIDFAPLSMSDLRTRPGEILDRVADDGAAFIIERNGTQKACLVPLSLFLPEIAPARIAHELQELHKYGEEPRPTFTPDRQFMIRFPSYLSDGTKIELSVLLPRGYPHSCPRVYASEITGEVPHRWADGALCLFGVMAGWNPGKHTVFTTLQLARQWLQHYDTWRKSGLWPKAVATHE